MKYTPKSDEELLNLLDDGEYTFVVKEAQDMFSKTGNEMIKLKLEVSGRTIFDYLLEAMEFKIKHFSEAVGIDYAAGSYFSEDCVGKSGRVKIGREEAQGNYQAKNKVVDYVKRNSDVLSAEPSAATFDNNDDIPF